MMKQAFYGSGKWFSSTPEDVWLETQRGYGFFKYDAQKRWHRAQLKKRISLLRQSGRTQAEAAKILGVSVGTVRNYDHRKPLRYPI